MIKVITHKNVDSDACLSVYLVKEYYKRRNEEDNVSVEFKSVHELKERGDVDEIYVDIAPKDDGLSDVYDHHKENCIFECAAKEV